MKPDSHFPRVPTSILMYRSGWDANWKRKKEQDCVQLSVTGFEIRQKCIISVHSADANIQWLRWEGCG